MTAALVVTACGGSTTPPSPSPPGPGGESITGRERLGWDQRAGSTSELQTFRYAIYVDNVRSELGGVACAATSGEAGFPCSAPLPAMSNGTHVLELAAFIDRDGILESARSQPFRVTVTGVGAEAGGTLTDGDVISTSDGVQMQLEVLSEDLRDPTALAIAPDGRVFVGSAAGILMLDDGEPMGPMQLTDGETLALGFSPEFDRDGFVFVTQAVRSDKGGTLFRTLRLRDMGGWLADRMVILEHGPPSSTPASALRFAADGKLHLAFDDGGSAAAADRMSDWRGKLLRMEPDGRTPRDQAAASPVLWRGLSSPRGFDWAADGVTLWLADASRDGVERLRVIVSVSTQPRRATQAASYVLPRGLGASGLLFYRGAMFAEFAGDLLVAGGDGGYILRIRFAADAPQRPSVTERLLEGSARTIRAMALGADGAVYVCTDTQLIRLKRLAGSVSKR